MCLISNSTVSFFLSPSPGHSFDFNSFVNIRLVGDECGFFSPVCRRSSVKEDCHLGFTYMIAYWVSKQMLCALSTVILGALQQHFSFLNFFFLNEQTKFFGIQLDHMIACISRGIQISPFYSLDFWLKRKTKK